MMPEILQRTIDWHQTDNEVYLNINIDNPKDVIVRLENKRVILTVKNDDEDSDTEKLLMILEFYESTNNKENTYNVIDDQLRIVLKKESNVKWTRLSNIDDPPWINETEPTQSNKKSNKHENKKKNIFRKVNSAPNVHREELEARDLLEDYPQAYDELHKEEMGYRKEDLKKVYLVLYNLFQYIGYMYILIIMMIRYSREGPASMKDTYETVGNAMKFIQLLQFLEVMHPAFGYTKGNSFIAFLQVSGRAFILFCMIEAEPRMQTKPIVFYVFFIWSFIEIFRYPYYITQLLNFSIPLLTWLRYTIWIPLYPLGFLCEGIIVLRNIPYFEETNKFTISLPNSWNFGFHFPTVLRIYLLFLCLPGMYTMMSHMSQTRNRKLTKRKVQ